MRADPEARADGKCALAGCGKPVPPKARKAGDPFHSTECCKEFHGVVFKTMKE